MNSDKYEGTTTTTKSTPTTNCTNKVEQRVSPVLSRNKIGRNDKCSCGSGKKYKKCCLIRQQVRNII
jgi:uncharacterized protein YecA (UPF0149 family)